MRRGVIMHISKRKAVILTKEGSFERVRLKRGEKPVIGQEYIYPLDPAHSYLLFNRDILPSISLSLVMIIIFVVVAGGIPFGQKTASAAAYVSFDNNLSVQVAVDSNMNIIGVRALNRDAQKLLESRNYQNTSLVHFSQSFFRLLDKHGYLDNDENLLITTTIDDSNLSVEAGEKLEQAIEKLKSDKSITKNNLVLSIMATTPATRTEAEKHGVSMGKYLVYQDAVNRGKSITLDMLAELSYTELKNLMVSENGTEDSSNEPVLNKKIVPTAPIEPVNMLDEGQNSKPINQSEEDKTVTKKTKEEKLGFHQEDPVERDRDNPLPSQQDPPINELDKKKELERKNISYSEKSASMHAKGQQVKLEFYFPGRSQREGTRRQRVKLERLHITSQANPKVQHAP